MTIKMEDLLSSILQSLDRIDYIRVEEIPAMDLYMDQVTTLMERRLKNTVRNQESDKILTKTMINNYAKNDLLPPPRKKKYSREHVLLLILIYYYKGFLSIGDIRTLLQPLTERFFGREAEEGLSLEDVYSEVFALEKEQVEALKTDVADKFRKAGQMFQEAERGEQEFLQLFSLIGMLGFDVYVKKLLIEKLLDGMQETGASGREAAKAGRREEKEKKREEKKKEEKRKNERKPSP